MTQDDTFMAAEYVLGLLDVSEHSAAQTRLRVDAGFSRAVADWEEYFAEMTADIAPVAPSVQVKRALEQRLFSQPATPWWAGVGFWRGLSFASLALVAVLGWQAMTPVSDAAGPLYPATIASVEGDFRVVVVVDKSVNQITLTRTAGAAPAGRILQVWAHGENAPATSVGLWPEGDTVTLPLTPVIADVTGILTIGVSEEPPGGSVTGSPSGRVFGTVDIPGVRDGI